ncbi:DUF4345 domain-containing protein [Hellea balneolensis]|uniref:DUF4345 domain-containing protein n=1 Tax=Hellea balneolensis TaxID=287478 RepID=UPI0004129EC6|nr:DUF4345 domain-containing protein [Hellea balneolensis]
MKRGLQIVLAILSLIPLFFAVMGLIGGAEANNAGEAVTAGLDNQFRYLSAYYLSLFFLIWWVLQDLENRGAVLRLLVLAIFLGGLARLFSYLTVGPPPANAMMGMVLELGSPSIVLWHNIVAKKA